MTTGKRPTLGLIVQRLDPIDTNNVKFWKTAYDISVEEGNNLLMIAGHSPDVMDRLDGAYTAVYRMLNPALLDGAILTHMVTERMTEDWLERFSAELPRLPYVATNIKVRDWPVMIPDNAPGLRDLMRHLIEVHGFRRIVHVRGPHPHREAQLREDIWRQELKRAGIEPEASWVVQGHFEIEGLVNVGRDLMTQTGGAFDAVVACNDLAALRVMEDLQAQGFRVPEDYVVCGFDDIQRCQSVSPSLTTVRQPVDAQTRTACAMLKRTLETGRSGEDATFDTSLVVRASCGCPVERWDPTGFDVKPGAELLGDPQRQILSVLSSAESRFAAFNWKVYALNGFVRALNRVTSGSQISPILHEWLPRMGMASFAVLQTCDVTGTIRDFPYAQEEGSILPVAPQAFRVLSTRPVIEFPSDLVILSSELALPTWYAAVEPFRLGAFPLILGEVWYGLAFLELSRDAGLLERAIQEQLASVLDRLAREKASFETNLAERTRAYVQTEQMAALSRLVSEVTHEINTPLGAIVSSNNTVRLGLEFLTDKTLAFWAGLSEEGREAFRRLWSSFRQAPGAVSRDRVRLRALVRTLEAWPVEDAEALADDLMNLRVEDGDPLLAFLARVPDKEAIVGHVTRMADLWNASGIVALATDKVAAFLTQLRTTTGKLGNRPLTGVDIQQSLETVVQLLQHDIRRGVTVVWQVEPVPLALCRAEEIQQVWTNLLRNAVQATNYRGQVTVALDTEGAWVRVAITDTGPGIRPADQTRIFTPFFSTKPEGQGLGLGLDISRRIVESVGGQIDFESVPGRTTFRVLLPAAES